jgi:SsrA-binding protein
VATPPKAPSGKTVANNRRASFQYEILERFEAGLVLLGTEVKALREGRSNLGDAFVRIDDMEAFVHQLHIGPYSAGSFLNHEPLRKRKLLLHKKQIKRIMGLVKIKGYTIILTRIYVTSAGRFKAEIALAKGKTQGDKREAIREREAHRDIERAFRSSKRSSS